jgi:hypothetical protein
MSNGPHIAAYSPLKLHGCKLEEAVEIKAITKYGDLRKYIVKCLYAKHGIKKIPGEADFIAPDMPDDPSSNIEAGEPTSFASLLDELKVGVVAKITAFCDENPPSDEYASLREHVAFVKALAAVRKACKNPAQSG